MSQKFERYGFRWTLREGFPPMGSREQDDPRFLEALLVEHPALRRLTLHEVASWVIARLNCITGGMLELEGEEFANDSNDVGYKLRLSDESNKTISHGAIVIHPQRLTFASLPLKHFDFQALVVQLLTEEPHDLLKCEIFVIDPDTRKEWSYGWNGHSLLN